MTSLRIAVFGAGGVGGYFGAVLARAGHPVAMIARGAQLAAIRRDGLQVESPKGDFGVAPAQAVADPAEVGEVDAVLVAVKAWQVAGIAPSLRPLLAAHTRVLPLQNGVEASDQLQQALGGSHALIGLCRIFSALQAPGQIRHFGLEPTIALGERQGAELSAPARALAAALAGAGVAVETPADIQAALWGKLLVIGPLSGAGAVTRVTIGELRQCPPSRALVRQLMEEIAAVACARGVRLPDDAVARGLAYVDGMPAEGTASMQRDVEAGRPSELEAILGAVGRLGREAAVPTPALDLVYASLLPQEQRARRRTP
jgi:2-dehydropantoate 2-reductase